MRFDGRRNHAPGIHSLQTQTLPFAFETLEVPPWNSILSAEDRSLRPQDWFQLRRKFWQTVRFYAEEDDVDGPNFFEGTDDCRARHKISVSALYLHAAILHGAKVWTASEQGDVEPGLRHSRPDVGPDCPGSRD
jgi:hypothetical protein